MSCVLFPFKEHLVPQVVKVPWITVTEQETENSQVQNFSSRLALSLATRDSVQ